MTDTTKPKALRLADELDGIAYSLPTDRRGWTEDGNPQNPCTEAAVELRRLADVEAERDALKAELETERVRLAACGVVAMSNTPESAARNRQMKSEYWSASCADVAAAVDREIALRAELERIKPLTDECRKDSQRLQYLIDSRSSVRYSQRAREKEPYVEVESDALWCRRKTLCEALDVLLSNGACPSAGAAE